MNDLESGGRSCCGLANCTAKQHALSWGAWDGKRKHRERVHGTETDLESDRGLCSFSASGGIEGFCTL